MSTLAHPRGPEPERTYWIRRAIVVIALLATIGVLVWIGRLIFGTGSSTAGPVATPNNSSLAQYTPTPTPSPSTPVASASASASASSSASASASRSASASASSSPTPTVSTCVPSAVGVDVSAPSSVKSGATAQLSVKFTNGSQTPCKVDFTQNPLTLTVTSGVDRIWSSADCSRWAPRGQTAALKPGASWTFAEAWPTKRSASGCTLRDNYLQPGTYVAAASIGSGQPSRQIIMLHG